MMKVKIGDKIYSHEDEPIMLIFDDEDDRNILIRLLEGIVDDATKLCFFEDNISKETIKEFMRI